MNDKRKIFIKISYDGTDFSGWQRQNNANTIQQTIEEALYILLREKHVIVGCGRTDTGVHASCYYFHLESKKWDDQLMFRINSILPKSISFLDYFEVDSSVHTRFDATSRSYDYFAHGDKNPFKTRFSAKIVGLKNIDVDKLNQLATLLLEYEEYLPFCKTNSDAKTMFCKISLAQWTQYEDGSLRFQITSNRFLRGMVRLIVGACINFAQDKISYEEVQEAMNNQTPLRKSWSAPAEGLFLSDVVYPFL